MTLSTWPEGVAKSTSDDTSVPTAPLGALESSFCAVSVGLFVASSVGAVLVTATFAENSEVLLEVSVAVAVTRSPVTNMPTAKVKENCRAVASTVPAVLPLTVPRPMKVCPSPFPPATSGLSKNSTVAPGLASPVIVTLAPEITTL